MHPLLIGTLFLASILHAQPVAESTTRYRADHAPCQGEQPGAAGPVSPQRTGAPIAGASQWQDADILASRQESATASPPAARPLWSANPMNLLVVVEEAGCQVSIVDGERLEPIHRVRLRAALQGDPGFTRDGRYVFFGSRDGWITKYDLWSLTVVLEVRAGLALRNIALSRDGRWIMAANHRPGMAVLFDSELRLEKVYPARDAEGKVNSGVAAVYDAAPRRSFVATFEDIPEIWEISYDPQAPDIFDGLVHDYRMREAIARPGFLGVRRTLLDMPLRDLSFDPSHAYAWGATATRADGSSALQAVNLDVRRSIATLPMQGAPRPGAGVVFPWNGRPVLASPNLANGAIAIIDIGSRTLVRTIATPEPNAFLRSHASSRHIWSGSVPGPVGGNTLRIIDKQTLEIVAELRESGGTLGDVEFTRDGRFAVASLAGTQRALIVYDADTLQEVRRLRMRDPLHVYNVGNRIARSLNRVP